MKFYVKEKLGEKQSLTPEGFLLCESTPIARTGTMIYGPYETPVSVGPDGVAHIEREAEEVFRPETVASFNGKPVVDEHPSEDVGPHNWNALAVGTVMNVHRGTGAYDDILFGDMVITNKAAIDAVRAGKREVSCGYDADYEEFAPGKGRQKNILGNHVALVDSGRCGPRCAIGDSEAKESRFMKLVDAIKNAFKNKDEGALDKALKEIPDKDFTESVSGTHVHVHVRDKEKEDEDEDDDKKEKKTMDAYDKRLKKVEDTQDAMSKDVADIKKAVMDKDKEDEDEEEKKKKTEDDENRAIEGNLEEEAPPGTSDRAWAKTKDSTYLEDSFQTTVALAEIISPGISVPTFDKKLEPKKTYDAMCQFRRRVLDFAYTSQSDSRNFMDEILQGRELKALNCSKVRDMFLAVGTMKKNSNNDRLRVNDREDYRLSGVVSSEVRTPADLNKKMEEYYKTH